MSDNIKFLISLIQRTLNIKNKITKKKKKLETKYLTRPYNKNNVIPKDQNIIKPKP